MTLAIEVRGLTKTYPGKKPVEAVRGIDLEVKSGSCFGLLGPNGAGKTTTIEILEGLLEPTSGTVNILGLNWQQHEAELRRRLGITLQETRLPERLTVREMVELFGSFYDSDFDADHTISLVALQEKAKERVAKLSGGQKQRLAVACALVGDPDLLFLDEPTTGLDPLSRRQLWDIISTSKIAARPWFSPLTTWTKRNGFAMDIVIIDHGQVIARGSPEQLIHSIGGEHVIEFSVKGDPSIDALRTQFEKTAGVNRVHLEADRFRLNVAHRMWCCQPCWQAWPISNLSLPACPPITQAWKMSLSGSLADIFPNRKQIPKPTRNWNQR